MKLQKHLSDKRKGKKYYKYVIVLPEDAVKGAGFKAGDDLKVETKKGKIELRKNG